MDLDLGKASAIDDSIKLSLFGFFFELVQSFKG